MAAVRPTITLHMVASLDGFVANKNNTVGWLEDSGDVYEKGVTYESAAALVGTIDCFVLGSRTYEHALQLGWPYGDTPTIVLTHRELPSTRKTVEFHSGEIETLVDKTLAPRFRNIWLVGGAILCQDFLAAGFVDEIRLSIVPVLLGDGLRLFADSGSEKRWRLNDVLAYKSGIVELHYVTPS